jgi:hypothetical protein
MVAPSRESIARRGQARKFVGLHRRHLTESQRAMAAARLATLPLGSNQHSSNDLSTLTQDEAAQACSVSVPSVKRARIVLDRTEPEITEAVDAGEMLGRSVVSVVVGHARQEKSPPGGGERGSLVSRTEANSDGRPLPERALLPRSFRGRVRLASIGCGRGGSFHWQGRSIRRRPEQDGPARLVVDWANSSASLT